MDFIGSDQEYLRKLQNVQKPVCLNFFHASSGRVYQNKGLLLLLQRLPSLVQKRCENKCKMQKNAPNPHSMIQMLACNLYFLDLIQHLPQSAVFGASFAFFCILHLFLHLFFAPMMVDAGMNVKIGGLNVVLETDDIND